MARPSTAAVRLLTGEREPVRLATTANITLYGLQTVDGVLTEVGDRVLVKNQTDATTNGIYTASAGTWYRASDARTSRTMQKGTSVAVQQGTVNGELIFVFTSFRPDIGTDDILVALLTGLLNVQVVTANYFEFVPPALWAGIVAGSDTSDQATYWQAFRDALAAISAAGRRPYGIIPECKIYSSVAPNFAMNYLTLEMQGRVRIRAIGAVSALRIDGHGLGLGGFGVSEMKVGPFIAETQTGASGIYIREVHKSDIGPLLCLGAVTTGIYIDGCVSTIFRRPTCSAHTEAFLATPAVGIRVTGAGGAECANCTFETPIAEDVPIGMSIENSYFNIFNGGTAELCSSYGIKLSANAHRNSFYGLDLESNTTGDLECLGDGNKFYGIDAPGNIASFSGAGCFGNRIYGGFWGTMNWAANTTLNVDYGVAAASQNDLSTGATRNRHRDPLVGGVWVGEALTAITIATEPVEDTLRTWTNSTGSTVQVLIDSNATSIFLKTNTGLRYSLGAGARAVELVANDKVQVGWASLPDVRYRYI